ncbi:ArdC family protein [Streptomyces sp. NRRL F-5630]|uniref:ArdC family protein n=1 Tax=Streptomyces sp. NRRL F-5630 TaxID=1463864 RepID=UPI003EC07925
MRTTTTTRRRTARRRSPEDARAEIAALKEQFDAQVLTLATSEGWHAFLRICVGMNRYSLRNQLLIMGQRPDAIHVAAYGEWQRRGRQVKRGEHGIRILAPRPYRPKDTDTDAEAAPGTEDAPESEDRPRVSFRAISVFDISQTEPLPGAAPLPAAPELPTGQGPAGLWEALARWAEQAGYTLERGDCGTANGFTRPADRVIRVRADLEPAAAVRTLTHEVAHILCGHVEAIGEYHQHRGRMETEAESVAYIVTSACGMTAPDYSVYYVAHWATNAGPDRIAETLRSAAETVATAAQTLLGYVREEAPTE